MGTVKTANKRFLIEVKAEMNILYSISRVR